MVFYIALYLCSGLIADFYNQPILVDLSKVVFLMLPFQAVGLVSEYYIAKRAKIQKTMYYLYIIIYNFCNCCYYFCIYL